MKQNGKHQTLLSSLQPFTCYHVFDWFHMSRRAEFTPFLCPILCLFAWLCGVRVTHCRIPRLWVFPFAVNLSCVVHSMKVIRDSGLIMFFMFLSMHPWLNKHKQQQLQGGNWRIVCADVTPKHSSCGLRLGLHSVCFTGFGGKFIHYFFCVCVCVILTFNHADGQTNPTEKITSSAEVMTPFSYIAPARMNRSSKYKWLPASFSFSFPFPSTGSHHGNANEEVTPLLLLR